MGDGTKENPYTREDVLQAIERNGGTARGLDLSGKVFEEGIDLSGLNLERIILKKAILIGARLEGAKLTVAHLEGANLQDAHLERADLTFAHVEQAQLIGAHLEGAQLIAAHLERAYLIAAHLEGGNLSGAHLEGGNLIAAHLEEAYLTDAHLEGADLTDAHLKGAYLNGIEFSADTRLELVDWGNYILGEEKERDFHRAEDTYRRLKTWYREHGMYDIAGEFFFREMEAKRKNLRWLQPQERRWLGWWPLRGEKVRLNVYKWLYGYGERPWRVILWGMLVLFGLALLYFFLRGVAPYTLTAEAFLTSLYYSAVSFTALGYGPWFTPTSVHSWVQGVGAAESFIGVFIIALFLVTFTRKMTR